MCTWCHICLQFRHRGLECGKCFNNNFSFSFTNVQLSWQDQPSNDYHTLIAYTSTYGTSPTSSRGYTLGEPSINSSTTWYIDRRATHHVILYYNTLIDTIIYTCFDKLYVKNDEGIPISSHWSSIFHIPSHSHKLNNVLHVLNITCNLLSV